MVVNAHLIPECPPDSFWVFGYGSLMWRPGFEHAALRPARLYGYHRALCILSHIYRGTPERPGLVFGLEAGGSCVGRAFLVDASRRARVYDYLMEREMIQGVYRPRWRTVYTPQGTVSALCFVADRSHGQYSAMLDEAQMVARIQGARGRAGANIDYIVNTCRHLEELGIHSPKLARIRDAALRAAGITPA